MSILAGSSANLLHRANKRIVTATAAFSVAAIVGATSFAAAQTPGNGNSDKPTKEWCAAHGFKNYGQCVREWAMSHGYDGSGNTTNNVTTNVSMNSTGDHNTLSAVINNVFH